MTINAQPGQWYTHLETGQIFEIVALDEASTSIEIQYVDGDIDEIDAEAWDQLPLGYAAAPEDPGAGFDGANGFSAQLGIDGDSPLNPPLDLDNFEPELFPGSEDF